MAEFYIIAKKPDLKVDFIDDGSDRIATDQKIKFYQNQFPDSSVLHEYPLRTMSGYNRTLLIPSGHLQVVYWDMLVAIVMALALQLGMFDIAPRIQSMGYLGLLVLAFIFVSTATGIIFPHQQSEQGPTPYECIFFFFLRYPVEVWLLTLGAIVLVQWIAWKRIRTLEII